MIQSVKQNIAKKLWKLQGLKDIHTPLSLEAISTLHGLLSWHYSPASYMARHISLMSVVMFQANILIFRKRHHSLRYYFLLYFVASIHIDTYCLVCFMFYIYNIIWVLWLLGSACCFKWLLGSTYYTSAIFYNIS